MWKMILHKQKHPQRVQANTLAQYIILFKHMDDSRNLTSGVHHLEKGGQNWNDG